MVFVQVVPFVQVVALAVVLARRQRSRQLSGPSAWLAAMESLSSVTNWQQKARKDGSMGGSSGRGELEVQR